MKEPDWDAMNEACEELQAELEKIGLPAAVDANREGPWVDTGDPTTDNNIWAGPSDTGKGFGMVCWKCDTHQVTPRKNAARWIEKHWNECTSQPQHK